MQSARYHSSQAKPRLEIDVLRAAGRCPPLSQAVELEKQAGALRTAIR